MIAWFPDAESVRIWGGTTVTLPFTEESLVAYAKVDQLPSYALVMPSGELCGFGQYYLRAGRCHLSRLVIAPEHRGRRLGERLIGLLVENGMRELGVTECSLFVFPANVPAVSLYRRLGFVRVEYPGNDCDLVDCHYMVKL